MRVLERAFSDFLRRPNEVVRELSDHDIVLRRRNAPALRLSQEDRAEARAEASAALARLLRNIAVNSPSALDAAVEEAFPWTAFLPLPERDEFVRELATTLAGSAELENFAPAAQLLVEWRATAEIHADPELARHLSGPLVAAGPSVSVPKG